MKVDAADRETTRGGIKPALGILGACMIALGLYLIVRVAWLGGSEVLIGVLAFLALTTRPKSAAYAASVLGIATLLLWLSSLTFLAGMAFVLISVVAHRASLPPAGRPSPKT
jgi:hypothetical protein